MDLFFEDRKGTLITTEEDDFIPLVTKNVSKGRKKNRNKGKKSIIAPELNDQDQEFAIMMDYIQNSDQSIPFDFDTDPDYSQEYYDSLLEDGLNIETLELSDSEDISDTDNFEYQNDIFSLQEEEDEIKLELGQSLAWTESIEDLKYRQRLTGTYANSIPQSASYLKKQKQKAAKLARKAKQQETKKRQIEATELQKNLQRSPKVANDVTLALLKKINRQMHDLVVSQKEFIMLQPLPSHIRKLVIIMSKSYKLAAKTRGSGKSKLLVLYLRNSSIIPPNWEVLSKSLFERFDVNKVKRIPFAGKLNSKEKKLDITKDTKPKIGDIVGENAKPIKDSNLGHKMLLKMGWKPGNAIGKDSEAEIANVQVIVRSKHGGLGAE